MDKYLQELFRFILVHVTDQEFNFWGGAHSADLATERDKLAAEQLRIDCE